MEAEGMTSLIDDFFTCELVSPSPKYDYGVLAGLKELLPDDIISLAYTPEHAEITQIAAKWDARKFKTFAKYGSEVAAIIEKAIIPGRPYLRIQLKEKGTCRE